MNLSVLSPELQEYVLSLIKRNVISFESLADKMLINYLSTLRIDRDYMNNNYIPYTNNLDEAC